MVTETPDCTAPHCPPSMHEDCQWPRCAPQAGRDDTGDWAAPAFAGDPAAPELREAMAETRRYREAVSEIRRQCEAVTYGGSYSSFARRILAVIKRLEGK